MAQEKRMASIIYRQNKWRAQIRKQGHRYFSKTFLYKDNARKWAHNLECEMDQGRHLLSDGRDLTLHLLFVRYLKDITILKKSRIKETQCLQRLMKENICETPLYKISMNDIQAYKKRRSNSPIALRNEIILIRHCLKIARSEWGLDFPTIGWEVTSLPKKPTSRKRRVSDEEYKALYETSKTLRQHYIWPAVSLAIETGMRRGELLKLEWKNINLQDQTALLEDTKNGSDRYIPLSPLACQLLSSLPKTSERVFTVSENALRLTWERLRKKAHIFDLRFHDLRHEALSRFTEKGLSPFEVAEISGHKHLNQLRAYTHMNIKKLINKL